MDNNDIVLTLKEIMFKKLLNDNSLGRYAKIHLEHLYYNYPDIYNNLIKESDIYNYFQYIQTHALSMKQKKTDHYEKQGYDYVTCFEIADDIVRGYLTSKQNENY